MTQQQMAKRRENASGASHCAAFLWRGTASNEFFRKFEKTVDKLCLIVYYIFRRRARHNQAMRRASSGA